MIEYFGFQSFFAPAGRPALVLTLSATMAFAASDTPKFRKGTSYATARATLLARGWSPVKASTSSCEPGQEDICAAYPETQSCAGTGFGMCTFEFKSRSGSPIEIVTHGGSVQKLTVSEVIDCPKTGCRTTSAFSRRTHYPGCCRREAYMFWNSRLMRPHRMSLSVLPSR
jgi:hypothetical protein